MAGKSLSLSRSDRTQLYTAAHVINSEIQSKFGLQIPFDVYLQDPLVAKNDPKFGFDGDFFVRWEPGFTDGPTSSRFVVVDYNGDTGQLIPPAEWDGEKQKFVYGGQVLDRKTRDSFQFRQVHVWAVLQRALDFYQGPLGLGRSIPWGFEGNRLIVVPYAGYGKNAFYDRQSKSLQFYYFDSQDGQTVYTCLATDIINHEFGHAVLDGIRPYYLESVSAETAAFHESIGDLTAILIILRNNEFRRKIAEKYNRNLGAADELAFIAEQFGKEVKGHPYLRTAKSDLKMGEGIEDKGPHYVSQILTGTMFDILMGLSEQYLQNRGASPKQAFNYARERMQRTAIQPLDLLPPVDVTFRDYALAVLRAEELRNPTDPYNYYKMMLNAFVDRNILNKNEAEQLLKARYLHERFQCDVYPDIGSISRSRATAYRFLDDNREALFIPRYQDLIVADLYDANKFARQALRLPRQIILQYLWREDVKLDGSQYGQFNGKTTNMLCGGTLVFDEYGNLLYWSRKPGVKIEKEKHLQSWAKLKQTTNKEKAWRNELKQGKARRTAFLANIAKRIKSGQVGFTAESNLGFLSGQIRPIIAQEVNGTVHFMLTHHLHIEGDQGDDDVGGRRWEASF